MSERQKELWAADHPAGVRPTAPTEAMLEAAGRQNGADIMSGTLWFTTLGIIYLVLLCTLAVLSFRKGHWVLGLIGFIFPVLWIVGAILPGRRRR
jgi:hypothetical protein